MTLDYSNVKNARTSLDIIIENLEVIKNNNEAFEKLFNEPNFQSFVRETSKGLLLNEQLVTLKKQIESMYNTIKELEEKTEAFLDVQESSNK